MILFQSLFLLFFLIKGLKSLITDCFTQLIELDNPRDFACGSPGKWTAADLDLPPSARQFIVFLTIKPTYAATCSYPGASVNFFTVSIEASGIRRNIMTIAYDSVNSQFEHFIEDTAGYRSVQNFVVNSFWNAPYNFFLVMDMNSGAFTSGRIMDIDHSAITSVLSFPSNWFFDGTTEISVGSGIGGVAPTAVTVHNLKVTYDLNSITGDWNGKVTFKADYKFNDDIRGNTLANSQGTLGPITLNSASPSLMPEGGLDFTDETQYLRIPTFTPAAADPVIVMSFAIHFQIKIDAPPSNIARLFYYEPESIGRPAFSLSLTPTMALINEIDDTPGTLDIGITEGEWTTIYLNYIYTYGNLRETFISINGVIATGAQYAVTTHASNYFRNTDIISIGPGFIGQLRRVQVYSPGVMFLAQGTCVSSSCNVDSNSQLFSSCLLETCTTPGYYTSFGNCEKCLKGCATCSDPTTCQSCTEGYYKDDISCKKCPMHCKTCDDSQACLTCDSGYGFFNNFCILCPIGTYLTNDQFCKEISKGLQDTLTNSQLVNSAATSIANLISKGSSVSLSAMVGGKIFSQIKYLNISYSGELQVALLTWLPSFVSLGLTPDMPESIQEKIPDRHVPYMFEKYETSSSFLINFWENLGIIIFAALLCMLLKGIDFLISPQQNPSKVASFIRKFQIMIQNFLLAALYGTFGDLILFAILEYRSFTFGWNLSLLSFIFTIILLLTMFLILFYQMKILKAYQRFKQNPTTLEKFMKSHEGSQMFFKDFNDSSLGTQLFPFFLSARDMIFSFILVTMFEYPLVQVILVTILDFLFVAYLFLKRPFESRFDFIQQLFFEFVGLGVMISVFINAIFDSGKYQTFTGRNNIGKFVIVANLIFNFVTVIFMLIIIGQSLLELYKERQQKQAKKLKHFALENRLHNPSSFDTSQADLKNHKNTDKNLFSHSIASNETISFQQENFDFSLNPLQKQPPPPPPQFKRSRQNRNQNRLRNPPFISQPKFDHFDLENSLRYNDKKSTQTEPRQSTDSKVHGKPQTHSETHRIRQNNQGNQPRRPQNRLEKGYQPKSQAYIKK